MFVTGAPNTGFGPENGQNSDALLYEAIAALMVLASLTGMGYWKRQAVIELLTKHYRGLFRNQSEDQEDQEGEGVTRS